MGVISHRALLVTGSYGSFLNNAHAKAVEDFKDVAPVSPILESPMNGYESFVVGPDGSKEGWEASDKTDIASREFVDYLSREGNES